MPESSRSRCITWLATAAVAGCILQWIWFDWRLGELEYQQARQLRDLETKIARLNSDTLTDDPRTAQPSTSEITLSEHSLNNALDDLDSGNLITRYQAAERVEEYGEKAIPKLIELIPGDDNRARESALILLGQMDGTEAFLPELRKMLAQSLNSAPPADADGENPEEELQAGLLGLLARYRDENAAPLFSQALSNPSESVRTAAMLGLRRLKALDVMPALLARLGKERDVINRELQRSVLNLFHQAPREFQAKLKELEPHLRYQAARLLNTDDSAAAREVLRDLVKDQDPRVALTAAHFLAKRGDKTGRDVAEKIAGNDGMDYELRALAKQVVSILER